MFYVARFTCTCGTLDREISAFVIIGMCRQSLAVTNINAEHNLTSQYSTVQHMHFMSQRISLLIFVVGIDGIWNSSTYDNVFRCHLRQSNAEFGICPSTIFVSSWMECGISTTTLSLDILYQWLWNSEFWSTRFAAQHFTILACARDVRSGGIFGLNLLCVSTRST